MAADTILDCRLCSFHAIWKVSRTFLTISAHKRRGKNMRYDRPTDAPSYTDASKNLQIRFHSYLLGRDTRIEGSWSMTESPSAQFSLESALL